MSIYKIICFEFLLIFSSVCIFRSLWMIFDRIFWMNQNAGIYFSLFFVVILTFYSLLKLNQMISLNKR